MTYELIDIIECKCELGEGIFHDEVTNTVWWTDILGKKVYRYDLASKALKSFAVPMEVAAFKLTGDPDVVTVAFFEGFADLNLKTGEYSWIARLPELGLEKTGIRLNDGRIDAKGRFWVGACVQFPEKAGGATGKLYCLDTDGSVSVHGEGFSIFNGCCWSPDSKTMFFTDTAEQTIYASEFDLEAGVLSNRRVFARTSGDAYPDGACTDDQGGYLSGQWGTAEVMRFNADGTLDQSIPTPTKLATCTAVAGDLFFVTSGTVTLTNEELKAQPNAGDMFVFKGQS